jgi:hypothetical protein
MSGSPRPIEERLLSMTSPEPNSGCWLWMGSVGRDGYGVVRTGGRSGKCQGAHRVAYELFKGPILDGMVLDHLCRVRCCINPDHLQAVTLRENIRRGMVGHYDRSRMRHHASRPPRFISVIDRFMSHVEKVTESGCWIWMGATHNYCYGAFILNGRSRAAHRVAYALFKEPIPEGLTIDHLCGVTYCVNPLHLEAVTNAVNAMRAGGIWLAIAASTQARSSKPACVRGHLFTDRNTYRDAAGVRYCRECRKQHSQSLRDRLKAAR